MSDSRELLIAVPGDSEDIYLRHQQVWGALHTHVRDGRQFLFRQVTPRLVRVRSCDLPRGELAPLRPGRLFLDLVVSDRYDGNKERDVPIERVPQWSADLLRQHGFDVCAMDVLGYRVAEGCKPASSHSPGHRIRYSCARLCVDVVIASTPLARKAWDAGIGRGRRFGFGMLTASAY